jgi:hypothetical protein
MKKEINGLLWYSMRTTKKIDDGFKTTDRDEDDKITPEEDTNAIIHVNNFNKLDTLSSADTDDLFTKDQVDGKEVDPRPDDKQPEEVPDMLLDKWELNAMYPMW